MKTKEEIYSEIVLQAPWYIDDHLEPYILEAMQVFAESYYKERTQANGTKTSHDKALHKNNVTVAKRKVCPVCKKSFEKGWGEFCSQDCWDTDM